MHHPQRRLRGTRQFQHTQAKIRAVDGYDHIGRSARKCGSRFADAGAQQANARQHLGQPHDG